MGARRAYRAVLFDLGNTLVSYYDAAEFLNLLPDCLRAVLARLQLHPPPAVWRLLVRQAATLNREREDHAVWPLAQRLQQLLAPLSAGPLALEQACDAFLGPIFQRARLDPAALPTLRAMRAQGLRLGIVSNTPWGSPPARWQLELVRHGLADAVDVAVFCGDVGFRKPHPAPFQRAARMLEATPEQTLFVGDDPAADMAGAAALGFRAVWLQPGPRPDAVGSSWPCIATLDRLLDVLEPGAAA